MSDLYILGTYCFVYNVSEIKARSDSERNET